MRPLTFQPEQMLQHLYQRKVLTMPEFRSLCGCSHMTAWRVLRQHGYFTSYNCNARYYTLADIPRFDALGLWAYRHIRFSRYGSLTQTLIALVDRGETGCHARELSNLVGIPVAPALSRLHAQGRIHRVKFQAAFLYVAADPKLRQAQLRRRQAQVKAALERSRLPAPDRIIAVLVELVCHPGLQPDALARRLSRRGVGITPRDVRAVFTRYDLAKKKGRLSC